MIELKDDQRFENDRISSKGNQYKFYTDNKWYKADYLGYEGLAEYVVSKLLRFSTLTEDEYTDYECESIKYKNTILTGCVSHDFSEGWSLITLERLFKDSYGHGLNNIIYSVNDHQDRLKILTDQVVRTTGLENFGVYMNKLLTIDALFLNEDRHTNNIAVLTKNDKFKLAPIFDNGACLLSDTSLEYPLNNDPLDYISSVKPKTFSESFEKQLEISERLYGQNIKFNFTYNDVHNILEKADIYSPEIRQRAEDIIMEMRRKYKYLFE